MDSDIHPLIGMLGKDPELKILAMLHVTPVPLKKSVSHDF